MVCFAPDVAVTFRVCETETVFASPTPTPVPDPFDDCDALEELEEEIVILAAHIHSADHRLLALVAEFDRRRGWELGGYQSCSHWLAYSTGIDLGTAREKVRAARALVDLPQISAAMSRGELSLCAVRALTRVATPETEGNLLELARGCTVAELERVVRAVEAADDALFREKGYRSVSCESSRREAARRRADALGLMAERALAAGFGAVRRARRVPPSAARAPSDTRWCCTWTLTP